MHDQNQTLRLNSSSFWGDLMLNLATFIFQEISGDLCADLVVKLHLLINVFRFMWIIHGRMSVDGFMHLSLQIDPRVG